MLNIFLKAFVRILTIDRSWKMKKVAKWKKLIPKIESKSKMKVQKRKKKVEKSDHMEMWMKCVTG